MKWPAAWPNEGDSRVPYWVYTDEGIYRREIERIFHGAAACNRVYRGADSADSLRESPRIARIASLENYLDAAELSG